MIKSPTHAETLGVKNPYQTNTCRVLCVCSVGMLRSPTLANVLHEQLKYNTRSCGVLDTHALVPASTALMKWADEIVFVDFDAYSDFIKDNDSFILLSDLKDNGTVVFILDIPDNYDWNDSELRNQCYMQYVNKRNLYDME